MHFTSYDGARLAYRRAGSGPPLVCVPGGPGRSPRYLGDLGGLGRSRELILPDIRGTGDSEVPADPAAYRCDRIARDVEALRAGLGLERMDLLGHSAGGNVALLYAAAHPERIRHLILLAPGVRALGLTFTDEEQQAAMRRRAAEPWFADGLGRGTGRGRRRRIAGGHPRLPALPLRPVGRHGPGPRAGGSQRSGRRSPGRLLRRRGVRPARDPGRARHPGLARAGLRGRTGRRVPSGAAGPGGRALPRVGAHGPAGCRPLPLAG